jgi:hypothetical protein
MKKKLLALGMFVFTFFAVTSTAYAVQHYTLGYSAVDEREIRWNGGSAYPVELRNSIATWNALGRVNIAPDTIWTYEDLRISDGNFVDAPWTGKYTYIRLGTDKLEFNRAFLVNDSDAERQNTITHEFGHALGLAHSTDGNMMQRFQDSFTNLRAQDISDYRFLWGN